MLCFGMGLLGSHFNPVCGVVIANGESSEAYEWTYRAVTESYLYTPFDMIKQCAGADCTHELCSLIKEQDS